MDGVDIHDMHAVGDNTCTPPREVAEETVGIGFIVMCDTAGHARD